MNRVAAVNRETAETKIALQLNLDGAGNGAIDSGIGFFDHMLNLMVVHGQLDLDLRCDGDLEVDGDGLSCGDADGLGFGEHPP